MKLNSKNTKLNAKTNIMSLNLKKRESHDIF